MIIRLLDEIYHPIDTTCVDLFVIAVGKQNNICFGIVW
jgi:hypothetical protein